MLIDYERVVLGLKEHIGSKRTHGRPELLEVLARLEVESVLPEGQEGFDDRVRPRRPEPVGAANGSTARRQ